MLQFSLLNFILHPLWREFENFVSNFRSFGCSEWNSLLILIRITPRRFTQAERDKLPNNIKNFIARENIQWWTIFNDGRAVARSQTDYRRGREREKERWRSGCGWFYSSITALQVRALCISLSLRSMHTSSPRAYVLRRIERRGSDISTRTSFERSWLQPFVRPRSTYSQPLHTSADHSFHSPCLFLAHFTLFYARVRWRLNLEGGFDPPRRVVSRNAAKRDARDIRGNLVRLKLRELKFSRAWVCSECLVEQPATKFGGRRNFNEARKLVAEYLALSFGSE